jgi:hypothetical protein
MASVISPYFSIALVVSTLLILSDVSLLTSLRTSVVIISISTTGLIAWLLVMREDRKILFPESIGMGLAVGFILCAGFQLVLRRYGFNIFGGLIPVIIAHSSLLFKPVRKLVYYQRLNFSVSETAAVLFTMTFGLYLNAPLLLVPAAIFAYVAYQRKVFRFKKLSQWSTQVNYFSIWLAVILCFILIALTTAAAAPYMFSESSESIPREAWSNSIVTWGPNENIPLFGHPLRYHWFSFAVFGLISRLAGLAPMVLFHSGLSALLDCLCVGSIVWSITHYLSKNRRTALLSTVILYGTVSLDQPYAILADSSPDATSWLVWVTAFAFALIVHSNSPLRFAPIIFSLIGVAAILSNGPHGVVLLLGLWGWLVGRSLQHKKILHSNFHGDIKLTLTTTTLILLAYFLFLTPSEYSVSVIDFSLRFVKSWRGALFVISFFSARFVALPMLNKVLAKPIVWFFYGISLGAIPSFFLYRASIWNLALTFASPGLVLLPIPIAILFMIHWSNQEDSRRFRWKLVVHFFLLGSLLQVSNTAINWRHLMKFNALQIAEYSVIFPILGVIFVAWLCRNRFAAENLQENFVGSLKLVFVIATVFCSLGVGLGYSVRTNVRDFVDLQIGRNNDDPATPTTSYLFRDAMLWLQHNSNQDDLVATNFIAGEEVRDFFTNASFSSSNLAISAVSRRRVLVEGDSWGNVGLVFTNVSRVPLPIEGEGIFTLQNVAPTWLNERLRMSHQFGRRPNSETAEYMKKMNINWFVASKAKQMPTTWEPYASVAFENSEVIILKLN